MTRTPLSCTVRGCGQPLAPKARTWVCARGHAFDVARSGYVNLLQPQDRRSADAGDPRSAVDARARLFELGIGRHLIDAVIDAAISRTDVTQDAVVTELGSGTGHLLEAMQAQVGCSAIGIELSTAAIELAAKRSSAVLWLVANADRRLPLLDGSIDLVLSVNARRNPAEARRVLRTGGRLLVAIPADDDLIELREAVQGEGVARDRVDALIAEHAAGFEVIERRSIREVRGCPNAVLRDLLASTYRGGRRSQNTRVDALEHLEVTFASELVSFAMK